MKRKSLVSIGVSIVAFGGLGAASASAGSVSADAIAMGAPATGAVGTSDLVAFSQQGAAVNKFSTYFLLKPGGLVDKSFGCAAAGPLLCPSPAPSPPNLPGLITAIVVDAKPLFSPADGVRGQAKPVAPAVTQSVESLTADALGIGQYQSTTVRVVASGAIIIPSSRAAGAASIPSPSPGRAHIQITSTRWRRAPS